ncbi:MAG TPA: DUF5655 domain-containing protein [Bacteroidota bacterium]|nr:DUF5655 domain-containing protein [Bacteroidota bacterium]
MDVTGELQNTLMTLLKEIGEHTIEQKKESIHVIHGRAFVGIHPKKSYLGVNVVLHQPKAFPRADKVEQVSLHRFHHFFKITSKRQMNGAFARLLREAYDLTEVKK